MATISYVDMGAIQRKEGGGDASSTSYLDIGAVQRQETGVVLKRFLLTPFVWPFALLILQQVVAQELGRSG